MILSGRGSRNSSNNLSTGPSAGGLTTAPDTRPISRRRPNNDLSLIC